jgi:hypothetical protein
MPPLAAVLETGPIPVGYWLSATACAGILRRAETRGKTLPPLLEQVLREQCTKTTLPTAG